MMHEHQNRETLAKVSVGMLTVHIWLAIGYAWYLVLQTGFFGVGMWGWLVAGLALIFLLTLGTLFMKMVLQEFIRNALAHQWLSESGCLTGITLFLGIGFYCVWALTRDLAMAGWAFLLAPLMALIAALVVTFFLPLVRRFRP